MERLTDINGLIPAGIIALGLLELIGALVYFSIREAGWRRLEQQRRMQGQFPERDAAEAARLATLKKMLLLSAGVTISAGMILGVVFQTI